MGPDASILSMLSIFCALRSPLIFPPRAHLDHLDHPAPPRGWSRWGFPLGTHGPATRNSRIAITAYITDCYAFDSDRAKGSSRRKGAHLDHLDHLAPPRGWSRWAPRFSTDVHSSHPVQGFAARKGGRPDRSPEPALSEAEGATTGSPGNGRHPCFSRRSPPRRGRLKPPAAGRGAAGYRGCHDPWVPSGPPYGGHVGHPGLRSGRPPYGGLQGHGPRTASRTLEIAQLAQKPAMHASRRGH